MDTSNLEQEFHKTVAVIRDLNLNPSCEHGPTILFDRNGSRFFSCSAYRCRKLCPFYLSEEEWLTHDQDTSPPTKNKKAKLVPISKVDDEQLNHAHGSASLIVPRTLPPPTQRDRGEAQYHFTEETINFFINLFQEVGISSVVCVGTPSLHQFLKTNTKFKIDSFLLDIDERLINQTPTSECAHYNMCNHFFLNNGKQNYEKFLKNAESLVIVTDPPFGAKVELIWNGALKSIRKDFYQCHTTSSKCEVLWVFPYFMEGHILSKCTKSNLKMSDYKVLYKNHAKFKAREETTGNGKSSPVRIFTTISLSLIKLPSESYRYCDICQKWVERRNVHCDICGTCPTKDGGNAYVHCNVCKKCVKPTWTHCEINCGTCHLANLECGKSTNSFKSNSNRINYKNKKFENVMSKQVGTKFKRSKKLKHKNKRH